VWYKLVHNTTEINFYFVLGMLILRQWKHIPLVLKSTKTHIHEEYFVQKIINSGGVLRKKILCLKIHKKQYPAQDQPQLNKFWLSKSFYYGWLCNITQWWEYGKNGFTILSSIFISRNFMSIPCVINIK